MDPYVGEIRMFAGNYAPTGWHFCDGTLLQISTYQALYSLIGTVWGGNGVSTFGLPDLRGRLPVGQGTGTGLTARIVGQTGGSSAVTLVEANLPAHNHTLNASTVEGTTASLSNGAGLAQTKTPPSGKLGRYSLPTPAPTKVNLAATSISPASGGSSPHTNVMPYQAVNYIISLNGMYPTRP